MTSAATPRHDLECQLCGKPATLSCGQCGGFFYCTRAHQVAHWTSLGHHAECGRIARQCARADDLRREDDLQWLSWARRATLDVDEGRETRCTVLRHLGVHGVDQFRRECACYAKTPFGMMTTTMTDAAAGDEDDEDSFFTTSVTRGGGGGGGGGSVGGERVKARVKGDKDEDDDEGKHETDADADAKNIEAAAADDEAGEEVSTWPRLYRRLGLPSSSPAALVLSTAATIHYALQITGLTTTSAAAAAAATTTSTTAVEAADAAAAAATGAASSSFGSDDAPLVIHVLGAEKELDQLPAIRALLDKLLFPSHCAPRRGDCGEDGDGAGGSRRCDGHGGGGATITGQVRRMREVQLHLIGPEVPSCDAAAGAGNESGNEDEDEDQGGDARAEDERRRVAKRRRRDVATHHEQQHQQQQHLAGSSTAAVVSAAARVRSFTHRGLYHEVLADQSSFAAQAAASAAAVSTGGPKGGVVVRVSDEESSRFRDYSSRPRKWRRPQRLPAPSLVVAPNAGLAAFTSWVPTLRALAAARPPAPVVVTDFTEEAARMGAALMAEVVGSLHGGDGDGVGERAIRLLPITRNPFRQPLSSRGNDNALPTYSNGFTFGFVLVGQVEAKTPSSWCSL